jgi:hypothetical protein|tara:strand:+ start:852 stop:1544 length:693 start_codon:yes stop_codon:yes gene_type:complete
MIKDFFKIKRHKFYIKGVGEFIPPQEVIEPALRGPKWFASLCPFVGKNKRAIDRYPKPITKTAKNCPGMLELFKNSFLIKFPCDLILETQTTGKYLWQKPSETKVLTVSHQTDEQIEFNQPLSSLIMIKFALPFIFQAPKNKVTLLEPTYWKNQPYKIAPGVFNFTKDKAPMALNVITLFEKKNKIYEFKKGEPMVLYYTLHQSTLELNENLKESFVRKNLGRTFSHRWS